MSAKLTTPKVAAFYQFQPVADCTALKRRLEACAQDCKILGTVLVAEEGINGTVSGPSAGIDTFIAELKAAGFGRLELKFAEADQAPVFHRLKVRIKDEIVTMGGVSVDPRTDAGTYVEPEHWNELLTDPEVVVVDTRNRYEVQLGQFEGAIDPETEAFRDFPAWVEQNLDPETQPKVAMYCTGGIRCEKATALLKAQGFTDVLHLRGGILNYLEKVPEDQSRWQGECFVFDNRVTVDHRLQPGGHEQCFNCRMPVSAQDKCQPTYEKHVSCPRCFERVTEKRRAALLERARQVALARARGEAHIGKTMPGEGE